MPGEAHGFESVEVVTSAPYSTLLDEFWATCALTHGGPPVAPQRRAKYHVAILARDDAQEAAARASVRAMARRLGRDVPVPVLRADFRAKESWPVPPADHTARATQAAGTTDG